MLKNILLTSGVKRTRTICFFHHTNSGLYQANNSATQVKMLFEIASNLERQWKFSEAEDVYKKIIYEINPKEREAYDKLVRLWAKSSVFCFTNERVDNLLEQYKINFPEHAEIQSSPRFE